MSQPEVHDLYCGLGGWAEGFISEGYKAIGYDIEKHDYGNGSYPGELVICDVLELHGSQLKNASIIVASPPCQEPSYRAMPWSRAKALNAIGPPHKFIALFEACFRIQREASEAAGHYIPMVVENVKGAQRWIGKAQAHFGSFYLWGDVGMVGNRIVAGKIKFGHTLAARTGRKNSGGSWFAVAHNTESGHSQNPVNGIKAPGMNWSDRSMRGQDFTRIAAKHVGIKQHGSGREWFAGEGKISRVTSSGSPARKAASAEIAKIPFPLASWIAKCYYPVSAEFRP